MSYDSEFEDSDFLYDSQEKIVLKDNSQFNSDDSDYIITNHKKSTNYSSNSKFSHEQTRFTISSADDQENLFAMGIRKFLRKMADIVLFSLPIIISYFFTMFIFNVINIKFIKELNNDLLTASLGLGITFTNFAAFGFILGFNQGLNALAAQAYGSRNFSLVGVYYQRAAFIANIAVIPLSILFIFSSSLLSALGVDDEAAQTTNIYTFYIIPALFGFALFDCTRVYLSIHEVVYVPLIIQLCTGLLQIAWSYLLINKAELGLKGAAISRCITEWLNFFLLIAYVKCSKVASRTWISLSFSNLRCNELWDFAKFSLIMGSVVFFDWFAFEVLTVISGHFGSNQIVCQVTVVYASIINFIISCGISTAVMTFVANSLGAETKNKAKNYLIVGCIVELIFLIVYGLTLYFFRYEWAHIFSNSINTIEYSVNILVIYIVSMMFFEGLQLVMSGALRGMGKESSTSIAVSVCIYGISLPMVVVFAFGYNMKIKGIWWGYSIGIWFLCSFFLYQLVTADWKYHMKQIATKIHNDSVKLANSIQEKEIYDKPYI